MDPRAQARIDQRAQEQGGAENKKGKVEHGVVSQWVQSGNRTWVRCP
jgi:hypothetical protein